MKDLLISGLEEEMDLASKNIHLINILHDYCEHNLGEKVDLGSIMYISELMRQNQNTLVDMLDENSIKLYHSSKNIL